MSCLVHISSPQILEKFILTGHCPDCKQRTRFIGFAYEWHGDDQTCLKCGRRFSDGEWMPLAFTPQSRQKSIAAAKKRWRNCRPKGFDSLADGEEAIT